MENKFSFLKKLLIAFALILFILFCASQKQASALSKVNDYVWDPDFSNKSAQHWFSQSDSSDWWSDHWFTSNWTNTTDYDLIGFHFNAYIVRRYNNQTINHDFVEDLTVPITSTGILWETDGTGILCYGSSDADKYILCPIRKNVTYTHFTVISIIGGVPNSDVDYQLYYELERSRSYFNYDSTDIIDYFEQSGVNQIVIQQQQTNDILTGSDTSGASSTGINDITSNASSINTELNSTIGTNDFVSIFTTFFSQIDNSTCSPLTLPIPFTNQNLVLPCLGTEFQNRIPLLWTLYTTIITGVIVFRFWRFYIDMFKHLLDPYSTGLHGVSDIAGGGK